MKFSDLSLTDKTVNSINNFGYTEATEVQEKAIPHIIRGKNLIVRSQTGSGKTAAFGIGLMERIASGSTNKSLILVPTRELAVQVCAELRGISQVRQLKIYAVYGGAPINLQLKDLSKRYEMLVATPGRLLDIYRRGKLNMSEFNSIVLDEAVSSWLFLPVWRQRLWSLRPRRRWLPEDNAANRPWRYNREHIPEWSVYLES